MNNLDKQNPLDSDLPMSKSTETGGLKTMTVFIIVLALHVAAIAGFVTWTKLQKDTTADVAQASLNKHVSDGALPTATASDTTMNPTDSSTASSAPASAPSVTPSPEMAPAPAASTTTETTSTAPVAATLATSATSNATSAPANSPVINPTTANANIPPAPAAPTTSDTTATSTTSVPAGPNSDLAGGTTPSSFYVVKAHDTLARIARHNHTTVVKLKAANNLNTDMLHIGQKLTLPDVANLTPGANATTAVATATSATPIAAPADTTSTAPAATPVAPNAPVAQPVTPAPLAPSVTTTSVATVSANSPVYIVKAGDTIHKIARHYKTTAAAIMTANNITDPAKLAIGTKLKIPVKANGKTETTTTTSAPKAQVQETPAPSARFVSNTVTMP